MSNIYGKNFEIEIFGASHSKTLGVTIKGVPTDYVPNISFIKEEIGRRKPSNKWTTPRREEDKPIVETGSDGSITITFENKNINDNDYDKFFDTPRPSHADYVQKNRYSKEALLGGGMASGRMTLPVVAAGAIAKDILKSRYSPNIQFKADVASVGGESKESFITQFLDYCYINKDSVGACIECTVTNPPKFIGEPFFNSVESEISRLAFSIPGIKAIEFGDGVACSAKFGSERNDPIVDEDGTTSSNNEGGINGGITNGNPIVFRVHAKPTPSIGMEQESFNFKTGKIEQFAIGGRHDICFALRLPVVIESIAAIALAELTIK